jgi:peptide/nickel transport system substrate-binding protein
VIRWRTAIGLGLILVVVIVASGRVAPAADAGTGGKLVYGLTLSPSGIDPHVNSSSELGIALSSVYDPLVWETSDGKFAPGLASSWDIASDGKTYTLHLRNDVSFHDGSKFNAEAVKANLDRIMDPATKSQKAVIMLGPLERTEVVDEYSVVLHLKEPFAPLLDALSQVYVAMASPTALKKWGPDYALHQVGTGPFQFKEYIPGDHLTLTVYPAYNWAPPALRHQGRAYLDEIEFRFFTEPATRALALQGNEAQVMGELPPQDAERLKSDPNFQIIPIAIPGQPLQFFINTQRPPTDDVSVRRALLFAVDRATIVNTLFKAFSPVAFGPLSANTVAFDPSVRLLYPFDPAKAAQLLDAAGWKTAQDGIRQKDGAPLRLDGYWMTWGFVPEVGALLQAQFRAVGIDLQTQTVSFPAALDAARQGKHNLMPFTFSGTDPDLLETFFASKNLTGFNWSKVSDPQLDQWLEQGAATIDPARRTALYAQIQERIMDQALILPVRDYVNITAASSKVRDLRFDVRGWFPLLYDVHLEP